MPDLAPLRTERPSPANFARTPSGSAGGRWGRFLFPVLLAVLLSAGAPLLATMGSGVTAAPLPHVVTPGLIHVTGRIMPTISGSPEAKAGASSTWCLGLYPTPNISYTPGCYGHDEPTISYMSSAANSGTDASWWQVLPANGASLEQGDLYATFWYGGTVADSASLNGVAFLEWQFYPLAPASTGAGSGTNDCQAGGNFNGAYPNNNQWFSCVIVWEVVGGNEQAAYAGPMDYWSGGVDSTAIMEMNSGDHLYVNYSGSTTGSGWALTVHDLNTGQFGRVVMAGGGSVDPRGTLNPDSNVATWCQLNWGASCPGEIAWAYEIGHSLNPSAGASCVPGDGTCDSYSPTAWSSVGDNQLSLPQLGAPGATQYPLRYGFSSSQGGLTEVNGSAGCPGASNCVYPWYVYQSKDYSFTFRASASTNNTYDYGNANQYSTTSNIHKDWQPPYANVSFVVNRGTAVITANPGRINQTGGAYTSGNLSSGFAEGTYQIAATAAGCAAYSQSWYFRAGVQYVVNINLVCGGAITNVNFFTNPATCGSVSFNAGTFTNGQTTTVSAGSYPVSSSPCAGYNVGTIQGSGAVSVSGGTATAVAGTGNIYANFTAINPKYTVSFSVLPAGQGNGILFNGSKWFNGQSSSFLAGSYAASPAPAPGYRFTGWTSSGGVGTVSGGTTTISGAGTLTATYVAMDTVSFAISPATLCNAATTFNTTSTFLNGQQGSFKGAGAQYPASAGSCAGYRFSSWTTSGGVAVTTPTTATTTATVTGNGTLTANYVAVPNFNLAFSITGICSVSLNGTTYYNGGSTTLPEGTYPIVAAACQYFVFSSWSTSSALLTVASGSSVSTTLVLGANGTLTATFNQVAFPVHVQITPSSCSNIGVQIGTSSFTSGQTDYLASGTYPVVAGTCNNEAPLPIFQVGGGTSLSFSAGNLKVSGGGGTFTVQYVPVLHASLTGPGSATTGSPAMFVLSVTGGAAPYTLSWHMGDGANMLSPLNSAASPASENHTYTRSGSYVVTVFVNDSDGQTVIATAQVTASAPSSAGGLLGLLENPLVLLLILVVVVAIVAVAVLSRRKKKGKLPQESDYYPAPGPEGALYAPPPPPP